MTSTTVKLDDLSCPICFETYDLPKSLSCGHSFCEECVIEMVQRRKDGRDYVICPECRAETLVPPEGLPTNYGLNRLVEQFSGTEDHVTIVKSHMMPNMESAAKRIAWKAIHNNSTANDMSDAVTSFFRKKFGGYWVCIIKGKGDNLFGFTVFYKVNHYITLHVQDNTVYIFKTEQDRPCWKCDSLLCDQKSCKLNIQIVETNLSTEMGNEISNFAKSAIQDSNKIEEISKTIGEHLQSKYGIDWNCFCTCDKIGIFLNAKNKKSSLQLQIGKIRIFVFK